MKASVPGRSMQDSFLNTTALLDFSTNSSDNAVAPATDASNVAITTVVVIFLIVGTAGNILTMYVIIINKDLHTPSNYFIVSLCTSDLISALVCSPLWLYRRTWGFYEWQAGPVLCKFYWVTDFMTNYVTSLHIVSFAFLRFIAVKRPFKVSSISRPRVLIYICSLWFISVVISLPLIRFTNVEVRGQEDRGSLWPSCSISEVTFEGCCVSQYALYISIVSGVLFYTPEACVLVLSALIAKELLRRRRWRDRASHLYDITGQILSKQVSHDIVGELPDVIRNAHAACEEENAGGEEHPPAHPTVSSSSSARSRPAVRSSAVEIRYNRERKTFTQLGLIVVAFMIGYIPLTVYLMWTSVTSVTSKTSQAACGEIDYWFGVSSYLCLRLSECMNPVMYNLGSSNIRNASKKLLRRLFGIRS